ncbi:tetratricopeptide repeat protein [Telmatocola sphagniphila]|uniref:Tetratricopeptide repeat protein n=1 Tax=Telmatocola sphagniphila TaxID=1123043 RepID=A0A8E6B923_9BACT|nr:DNA-directed RNA polymerase subunit alpha C-terminal domain-containing protein [Telmatocola sphagniphila]QVL33381.1 tetratricopeptide repeat protein [Telmatocola sphagniphila]
MDAVIDLKALLVEREDCDAGTVQKLREGLAQGGNQFKSLREVTQLLAKKIESSPPAVAKKLHLKLGIANYFLGFMNQSAENLKHAEVPLGYFYHGRALANLQQHEEALKALDRAEKSGYSAPQVQLQRANVYRLKGDWTHARSILSKLEELASHSAEFHYQSALCTLAEGDKAKALKSLEKAIEFDPGHTGALFQLGYFNDLSGNDHEAISFYERCLKYPPVHKGTLNNLGVLYEDNAKYDKAVECFNRLLQADPNDDRARLFLKDASASLTMHYNPEEEQSSTIFRQVLEVPVTDFELSVRSRNCLKKMGIRTLGDLTRITEASLLASKNFGETSLDEIKNIMGAKGLRIGQSLEQGMQYEMRYRPQQQLSPEEQAMMNKPVSDLNLSVRARKCMNRLSILTIGELVSRTADELLEAKNFGQTSLTEIREKLTELGIKLRGD